MIPSGVKGATGSPLPFQSNSMFNESATLYSDHFSVKILTCRGGGLEMLVSLIKHLTYRADHPVSQKIASLVNIFGDVLVSKLFT